MNVVFFVRVLAWCARCDGQAFQVDVDLGECVGRVEEVVDGDSAQGVGRCSPNANVDGLGNVVSSGANVERPADGTLKFCQGWRLVPAPAVAAASGLGVERERFLDAADRVLVSERGAHGARLDSRRDA